MLKRESAHIANQPIAVVGRQIYGKSGSRQREENSPFVLVSDDAVEMANDISS
jgi:hypothetical protein